MPKQDEFGRRKSSLRENSARSGCIWAEEIIPARKFCQNRMNSAGGNHPWEKISSKQDEFGRRESSLGENFIKTGCIRPAGIIPGRKSRQIRMNSVSGNHPCEKVMSNQDEFGWRKSSRGESFIKSGCIWPAEIIPARKFCQIRMNAAGENHPCEKIPSKQDEFGRRKSSLRESFVKTGCIRPAEIIPAREFHQIRMNSVGGNHPCEKMMSDQDEFRRRKSLELRECKENTGSLELRESVDILISVEL